MSMLLSVYVFLRAYERTVHVGPSIGSIVSGAAVSVFNPLNRTLKNPLSCASLSGAGFKFASVCAVTCNGLMAVVSVIECVLPLCFFVSAVAAFCVSREMISGELISSCLRYWSR